MRSQLKTWTALILASIAGMAASELTFMWCQPKMDDLSVQISIEARADSPPKVAMRKGAARVHGEQ
jgi:hypothetical protein